MANCYACNAPLKDDYNPGGNYQFNNALWLAFHGGYGMFVDNLDAMMPINGEDQWLRGDDGEYLVTTNEHGRPQPWPDPAWVPKFADERVLSSHPDYEAVICHDCAHELCRLVPWMERLLDTHGSHAHDTEWKQTNPDHYGWDYDPKENDGNSLVD